jgi:hypothetical protein
MAEAVTAVGTALLVFVTFGQLVFYWQSRLLNRSTSGAGAATVVDMNDFAEKVSRMGGEAAAGAGWSTRRSLAPHEKLDGKRIKAGTFEESYLAASFLQAADVLPRHPVLTSQCLKAAGISSGSGGVLLDFFNIRAFQAATCPERHPRADAVP